MNAKTESPLVCVVSAMDSAERQRHTLVVQQWQAAVEAVRELPDGYAFRFPVDSALLLTLAEFVSRERLCCPFFNFTLEVEAEGGPMWLRITGREGVKQWMEMQFDISSLEQRDPSG